jgi:hypothetical protein
MPTILVISRGHGVKCCHCYHHRLLSYVKYYLETLLLKLVYLRIDLMLFNILGFIKLYDYICLVYYRSIIIQYFYNLLKLILLNYDLVSFAKFCFYDFVHPLSFNFVVMCSTIYLSRGLTRTRVYARVYLVHKKTPGSM